MICQYRLEEESKMSEERKDESHRREYVIYSSRFICFFIYR
jgi:hypothetical protein